MAVISHWVLIVFGVSVCFASQCDVHEFSCVLVCCCISMCLRGNDGRGCLILVEV